MAKGVKRIKWTGKGKVIGNLSIPNKKVVISPDQDVFFEVDLWHDGTTETDKKKSLTWMLQDRKKKIIISQKTQPANTPKKISMPKALCGPFEYYIEASISGTRDLKGETGLIVSGYCEPKVLTSKWCTKNDGDDVRKGHIFSYGEAIYLSLNTEGLNGHKNLIVDVFRHEKLKIDSVIFTYTSVDVIDGEINLAMLNTFSWYGKIKGIKEDEEFYVKVKDPSTDKYIVDDKHNTEHGQFLRIQNKIVSREFKTPTNLTPLKVGKPDEKAERYEPCKFETITIDKTIVFDKGKKLQKTTYPKDTITKTIFFDIDSSLINAEGNTGINNILQFLLEHDHSTITINGYACVIGKENYNQILSQKRSDAVKKMFVDGGLDARRILSKGHGEINATDDKMGRDNIKYKDTREYIDSRKVNISFVFNGHDAQTIVYEVIAPSRNKNLPIDITEYQNKACFREKDKHQKKIVVSSPEYDKPFKSEGGSSAFPVRSNLSILNPTPIKYIWPKVFANEYFVHVHSCRYFSNDKNATVVVNAYSDIKWTLEFKWNHKQPFAYTYGNKLHPHDIKIGKEKVIKSEIDRQWSEKHGEMEQSFELSLQGVWDEKAQKMEIGKEFGAKIGKTLAIFNKIKSMTESISNSPLAEGKVMFEVKAPVIAVSAQWYLQKGPPESTEVTTIVVIGVETKPLVEASFNIDVISIFIETAGNGVCPGAGKLINWILNKIGKEAGIKFYIEILGAINIAGQTTINILYPKETTGEIKTTGEITVKLEFKAWAKGKIAAVEVDGLVKANVKTSVTGGLKFGANKKGIYSAPIAEFGGIVATFVATGTVKFGVFKKSLEYESPPWVLVEKNEVKFSEYYLDL
jgi:outer membrane protein OmpA-like peptidoglycan-associated protein